MPQGAGQGLHIYTVLQRQRRECMSEVVESDVLRTDGFKDLLMGVPEGIRVEHPASLGRWEHIRISRDRRKFCVIDEPRQYENHRLSQE